MTETIVFDLPPVISENDLRDALLRLPRWRLSKALKYRKTVDRFLCAKAYLLLEEGLERLYGIKGPLEFECSPTGKPSLAGHGDIHFNLSHCHSCVCCIISDGPVGIDVEDIGFDRGLAEGVCSAEELQCVLSAEDPAIEFTRLWTCKESFLKLTGQGLRDDMKPVLDACTCEFKTTVNKEGGYVLTTARHDNNVITNL